MLYYLAFKSTEYKSNTGWIPTSATVNKSVSSVLSKAYRKETGKIQLLSEIVWVVCKDDMLVEFTCDEHRTARALTTGNIVPKALASLDSENIMYLFAKNNTYEKGDRSLIIDPIRTHLAIY